ncbi:RNA polymerase sigma-70 factor [Nocardioides sp.]|uniref:RNA polymerase sigma-70 factor n=1 Tax=Nocardioides sp. TaxID=35761 RepID=UPI002736359F|nr:RNA polymerase sigma-70 factor [Nocardioides sp.]MDP3894742.1 RNA polymerase sigma-70 factor [Nocardioides sp.]
MTDDSAVTDFATQRGLLFTVAYEMLGSTVDAEDVVQETWLRWADVDHTEVREARSFLVRIVTRLALNRLRTLRRRREEYVGPWLPEPLLTSPDVADDIELADSVSFAMLVVLESLTPLERAVFVLREVFGFEYAEIAAATERSPAAVRQLASRARQHVARRRPRMEPSDDVDDVAARFFAAAAGGDVQDLMDLLAPDVVLLSDGGGKASAALRPILGADKVARFLKGVQPDPVGAEVAWACVNGGPGVLLRVDGEVQVVAGVSIAEGRVTAVYLLRNPDKLVDLTPRPVSR